MYPLPVLVGLYGGEGDNLAGDQGARVVPRLYRPLDLLPALPRGSGGSGVPPRERARQKSRPLVRRGGFLA
jgi:hypothetical protein